MVVKINNVISKIEEIMAVILFLVMTGVVLWIVVCRYFLNIPFTIGEELARYLMIYCVFIGTGIGVKRGTHLGVTVFVEMLPAVPQKWIHRMQLFLTAFLFGLLFYLSVLMTLQFYRTGQTSTMMDLPMYMIFMALPIGLGFGTIHYLYNIYDDFQRKESEIE